MLHTSYLTIGAAVANRCEATFSSAKPMETDTISKNGQSSKSHTSIRQFLCCFVIVVFAVLAAFTSCNGEEVFDGVYVTTDNLGPPLTITFSGDQCKMEENGNLYAEGTFKVVQEQSSVMNGTINFAGRDWMYDLQGDKFLFGERIFKKQKSTPVRQELTQKKSVQEKWEYKLLEIWPYDEIGSIRTGQAYDIKSFNRLGLEGWELVSVDNVGSGYRQGYFKRRLP